MQKFDAVIIGTGAAGLYSALKLPEHWNIALVTKENLQVSASQWAQGGIAAVTEPDDSFLLHEEDTLKAGAGLCEPDAVRVLVEEAPARIHELLDLGVAFDRYQGRLAVTLEAAHSRPRILHAADATGKELIRALIEEILLRKNLTIFEEALALDLWMVDGADGPKHCRGVYIYTHANQGTEVLATSVTILAAGGFGQLFSHTTNPPVCTGDGQAIAYRAGALLQDLEFIQFHPTALCLEGAPRFLISEAVRGEGAHLLDSQGYRFMKDYHEAGELAPRDVVSRAIFSQLQKTGSERVWIDFRPLGQAVIERRFPTIQQVCKYFGLDVLTEPIPVAPAAHYTMGGVVTDLWGKTSVPGLYAVGEVASTGVHGANRLASNSLLECLVFARRIALSVTAMPQQQIEKNYPPPKLPLLQPLKQVEQDAIHHIRGCLPKLMSKSLGLVRNAEGLRQAQEAIWVWMEELGMDLDTPAPIYANNGLTRESLEVWNLLTLGALTLQSALQRTESRGAHFRQDYPQAAPNWIAHSGISKKGWQKIPLSTGLKHSPPTPP
ncbi:MAG: L-aspartate oxidase [Gloeobacterales cyanobacterium]